MRRKFSTILKGQRLKLFFVIVCVALASFMSLMPQQIIRFTVDNVLGGEPAHLPAFLQSMLDSLGGMAWLAKNIWACAAALLVIAVCNGLLAFLRGNLAAQASEGMACNLRNRIYDHLQHLSYSYHKNAGTGDLLQRSTSDVETIRRFFAVQVIEMGRGISMLIFAFVLMWPMNAKLTLLSLICVPIVILFSFIYFKAVQKEFVKVETAEGRMTINLQENLTGMRVVRAFGQQRYESDKFEQSSKEFRDHSKHLLKLMAYFWSLSDLIIYIQIGITMLAGLSMTLGGEITVGELLSFVSYTSMLMWPIRQLGRVLADMGRSFIALNRINEILEVPAEQDAPGAGRPEIKGNIEFNNVTFAYEDGRDILSGISFSVKAGETVAILGSTGSGKSSLVHLLQRLYDVREGSIKIDGVDVRDMQRKWLRRHVGIVLQEPFLFSRSIKENISITRPGAEDKDVFEAARIASIHQVTQSFDRGYETLVGERGVTLSGGQKQRVAIARMLMQDAPILVFDDSLSAMDTETDAAIRSALRERRKGVTTFIISHRVNTLMEADKILVLEDGRLAEQGTHQELIARPGLYQTVWQMQGSEEVTG